MCPAMAVSIDGGKCRVKGLVLSVEESRDIRDGLIELLKIGELLNGQNKTLPCVSL